jgi:hypothetical protein
LTTYTNHLTRRRVPCWRIGGLVYTHQVAPTWSRQTKRKPFCPTRFWPVRVPRVVAVGGGDVGDPGAAERADGAFRRAAMTCGPVPVRIWDRSSS